jgi:hypothetical protein
MEDGQKTPRGYPNVNSYMENLRVLVFRTDGRMDGAINPGGLPSLRSSRLGLFCHTHKTVQFLGAILWREVKPYLKNAIGTE